MRGVYVRSMAEAPVAARAGDGPQRAVRLFQAVCTERDVSALEQVQVTLAPQCDDPLQSFLATALLALCPVAEIAIRCLPVA